ncbi:conserved protein of unknown function [Nitrospira japonica]|uniref:Uncharacterized protein n=1 Tax=Nitrospira japonica TaxID=1325564 RepID=A0A1W1I0T1_9BACT|nr:hypothetical protein [Nitrospira japonica]SLM46479.1 conserved protein of unknown function [Nitrospira japonica]
MTERPSTHRSGFILLGLVLLSSPGCLHNIHVTPLPQTEAQTTIPASAQVVVPFLALEGADHMPGIGSLDWPVKDFHAAAIDYFAKRRTFLSVGDEPAALTLTIKAWLTMRSRSSYVYKLRLESDLGPAGEPPTSSYLSEKTAIGSSVRWVTASDRDPIQRAVQEALDDLAQQIEADARLHESKKSKN